MASATIIVAIVCCSSLSFVGGYPLPTEGYNWREFNGVIPRDALPAGTDVTGRPIFVGQTLHDKLVVTSKIYVDNPKAYYGLGGIEYNSEKNIKILCTDHPERFRWIKIGNVSEIDFLVNKHLPIGGYEGDWLVYIGRIRHGRETLVGKVVISETDKKEFGLFITSKGKEILYKSFEILEYDPSIVPPPALLGQTTPGNNIPLPHGSVDSA